jgi:TIR domain
MGDFNTLSSMTTRELPEKFLVAFSFAGEQRDMVRAIAEAVEKKIGSNNVFFDEWFEHYIAGHDADLKLQEIYGEQCELVVVCISERYGGKLWTQAEHEAIRARVMKSRGSADRREQLAILPIRVGDGDVKGIPFNAIGPDVRNRPPDKTADLIVERLRLIVPGLSIGTGFSPVELSWPETPTPLFWPMADHSGVREAFAQLLDREAPWRFLLICGHTEMGKSHITRQMLANALRIPDLACGRFDFKGTTSIDEEVRAFVLYLGVPVPPANTRLNERLGHILDALKQRARPTLLVFDTYEAAGGAQDWVEKQLLPSLIRATWLRVVIAGQRVPEPAGAVWASLARAPIYLVPPSPADWFEYGKQYRPGLTLAEVETACRLTHNKASILAQLLRPET